MTLIELVLVMGLIALLLGFGVGAIAGLDVGTLGAGSMVRSTLRSANNWAVARQAPSRVRIDPETGRITAEGLAVVGTWHFEESPTRGAFGLDGELIGASLTPDGFIGRALRFDAAASGASMRVPVHLDPAFALNTGFQLQFAVRPEGERRGRLLTLGDSITVEVTAKYGLRITVATQRKDEHTGQLIDSGKAVLGTPDSVLEPDRWRRVLISFDRSRFCVLVEGVEVSWIAEQGFVSPVTSAMILGGGQRPWAGSIDNLVISAVGSEEEVYLPFGTRFPEKTLREIVFAAGGGLDRTVHTTPLEIAVDYDDGRREWIRVNLYGTVE
jgi:hypothetical protein